MSIRAVVATLSAVLAVFAVSCDRGEVSESRWNAMSNAEKSLIVQSLLGAETVAERKGGTGATYGGTVEEYVERIDRAYSEGDGRAVEAIWKDLADRQSGRT